ncbi:MAG: alpha amylase C-terminal domain-containing protein [Lachnospiraceae bacterium]|nr:alpha amylase C-terminal domain-containing protein [Lachnospiraceae bacterium]
MKEKLYQLMNWPKIEGIIYSEENHPEEILGPHVVGNSILYQVFFPFAQKVTLVLEEKRRRIAMEEADEAGFFAASAAGKTITPYHYELVDKDGNIKELKDPYAFPVEIKEEALKKFQCGIHYELQELLGSYITTINGVSGLRLVVWVPQAVRVSVVGEFNHWDGRVYPMSRMGNSDIFTLFIPGLTGMIPYQYEVKFPGDRILLQEDYFAAPVQVGEKACSYCYQEGDFSWQDSAFMAEREKKMDSLFFYEAGEEELLEPEKLADKLVNEGYTHLVLPETAGGKHFYEFSLGFGRKYQLRELVNRLHRCEIRVLLQWNISGIHDTAQKEYSNFYLANVLYIVNQYHLDGVVFSQMASLLYLDYGKTAGQWRPNIYGGNENLDAVEWMKHMVSILRKKCAGILIIANLDAIWPDVTEALEQGGLGFDYRYDTDFTRDYLSYLESDPYFRSGIHERITGRMLYAYRERFVMSFDQTSCSNLWERIPGEDEARFKTMKLALAYPVFLPGKVLSSFTVPTAYRKAFTQMVKESRTWNHTLTPLEQEDLRQENFHWINCFQHNDCTISFFRQTQDGNGIVLVAANFANAPKENFTVGVPYEGKYKLFFHTESRAYGGEAELEQTPIYSEEQEWDGWNQSITLDLEPLSLRAYVLVPYTEEEIYEIARKKAEAIRLKLEQEARDKASQLKESSLKDTLALQVEKCQEAISQGSEGKRRLESKQRKRKAGKQ